MLSLAIRRSTTGGAPLAALAGSRFYARDVGGGVREFGRRERAAEESYFRKREQEQLERLKEKLRAAQVDEEMVFFFFLFFPLLSFSFLFFPLLFHFLFIALDLFFF